LKTSPKKVQKNGEGNLFEKTPQFLTVKGFYSRFRYFAFATARGAGHGVRATNEETTFIIELLEIFQK